MELSLELLAARHEACDVDLEAHRGNIKALEYGHWRSSPAIRKEGFLHGTTLARTRFAR